jgi:hypothetical protein
MSREGQTLFFRALTGLRDALEESGAPFVFIGGVAVIALGFPRSTVDVDATVLASATTPEDLLAVFGRHGIVPRISEAAAFARRSGVLLAVHEESGINIDVSLARLPFEEEAIRSGREILYEGVSIRVPRAEDLIIYKLVASRPRDVEDAEKLILLYANEIDTGRIRKILTEFCRLLEDESRMETLERLLTLRH